MSRTNLKPSKNKKSPKIKKILLIQRLFINFSKFARTRVSTSIVLIFLLGFSLYIIFGIVHFPFTEASYSPEGIKYDSYLNIAQIYAQKLRQKDFRSIWLLYSSTYKLFIEDRVGKDQYIRFLTQKFDDVSISSFSVDGCQNGQSDFPFGVERDYASVCKVTIHFSFSSPNYRVTPQLSSLSQIPLIITRTGTGYTIVGGGPTDLQAPVLYPPQIKPINVSVPVIMYHRIAPIPNRADFLTDYGYQLDVGLTVTPQNFASQMDQLQNLGYHTITPNDLFNNLYYNLPLPAKPILLTFDDGRQSDFNYGLPILQTHNFTATFFIPPFLTGTEEGFHNHNKYMSFEQLRKLVDNGMFIENHSFKHNKPLWTMDTSDLVQNLEKANRELISYTHYPIQFIAYPGMWPYSQWNQNDSKLQKMEETIANTGFAMAFLDLPNNYQIEDSGLPLQIPRIRGVNFPQLHFDR